MKKVYLLLLMFVLVISLAGCNNSEFNVDGEFTAYEVTVHSNAPQVTAVTVTVSDGEIVKYNIDVRQGFATAPTEPDTKYVFGWNEKTKKELAGEYGMKGVGPKYELTDGEWVITKGATSEKEWFEQAKLIEDYLLENGVDSVEVIDNRISNIAGVTIKDGGYLDLAVEAVNLAKAGTFQAILCSGTDLYIAKMETDDKGEMSSLVLDVLQSDASDDTFAWNDKTKQELGNDYGMKGIGAGYEFADGAWTTNGDKSALEWFEQAKLITDYIVANGWNDDLSAIAGRGGTIDGTTLIDDLAGVTVHSQTLYDVLAELFEKVA